MYNSKENIKASKKPSEKSKKRSYISVYFNSSELFMFDYDICLEDRKELKKCHIRLIYIPLTNLFNLPINFSDNMTFRKYIKLIDTYKLFILQFIVAMAQGEDSGEADASCNKGSTGENGGIEAYKIMKKLIVNYIFEVTKKKTKEEDLWMNYYKKTYDQPHGSTHQGHLYGESIQQQQMFPV
ncbi:variable surface protein [Plasmodium gonderi]|uniref:Variable surface protein n=1 Tax=Plasmodium gonderi TaxID=77519 RepID=A0A1Y1JRR9_PLAGO|nr:variable surface protein [Plasmodium gonderi]GAW84175.1 variable surface protein [Plasmodium gonderi]